VSANCVNKYRLFPTKAQERQLDATLETCRLVYNSFVRWRTFEYETAQKSVGRYEQVKNGNLWLSRIGEVKCKLHRPLLGKARTCCLRRVSGKWFACITCEAELGPLQPPENVIGIDVGLKTFAALSDGTFIENPRFFRTEEAALAKAQRKQAKTKKRSKERREANKVVARIHERVRNRRHDFVLRCRLVAVPKHPHE